MQSVAAHNINIAQDAEAGASTLLIVGAGNQGRVVADMAELTGRWSTIAFLDDRYPSLREVDGFPVVGPSDAAADFASKNTEFVVAVGDNTARLRLVQDLTRQGLPLATVVHPTAAVSPRATLGAGTTVAAYAVVNTGARVADGCIINTGATVDHDCVLDAGVHVSPGAHLAGNVTVGKRTWLGTGVNVRNNISIGANTIIGVGAAVVSDIPGGVTAVGVPAMVRTSTDSKERATKRSIRGWNLALLRAR